MKKAFKIVGKIGLYGLAFILPITADTQIDAVHFNMLLH